MRFLVFLLLLPLSAMAYDGVVLDERGYVVEYFDINTDTGIMRRIDSRGFREGTIIKIEDNNMSILDERGNLKGYLDWDIDNDN